MFDTSLGLKKIRDIPVEPSMQSNREAIVSVNTEFYSSPVSQSWPINPETHKHL